MFLLIPQPVGQAVRHKLSFTFHNVSINTSIPFKRKEGKVSLHSTMFLLIRRTRGRYSRETTCFTFHNVSINTEAFPAALQPLQTALHSTMFLLIRNCYIASGSSQQSLHSTMFLLILKAQGWTLESICFTFHNVSINTL